MQAKGPNPSHAASQENLAGLVECVTFHNDESGFCVLCIMSATYSATCGPKNARSG